MPSQLTPEARSALNVAKIWNDFEYYLGVYEKHPLPTSMLCPHRKAIEMRNNFSSVNDAISDDDFLYQVQETLVAFGMDRRAAKLLPTEEFINNARLIGNLLSLLKVENYSLNDLRDPSVVNWLVSSIVYCPKLAANRSQVVTVSKTLHHILPKLLPPIDREYTEEFFRLNNAHFSSKSVDGWERVIKGFAEIYKQIQGRYGEDYLSNLVDRTPWSTSETKLIDNAIIGYVKKNNL